MKVHTLSAGTRYYFKVGASTEVGSGPSSPVKDVETPHPKYGKWSRFIPLADFDLSCLLFVV